MLNTPRRGSIHDLIQSDAQIAHLNDLNVLINNTRDFEMFKKFLDSKQALNDILCWLDIEAYTRIDPGEYEQIEEHARMLKKLYLNKKYIFSKNGPIDSEAQNIVYCFFRLSYFS